MDCKTVSISIPQKYYTLGNKENPAVLILHGYGQNGQDFIQEFDYLKHKYYLICPNAPNAFYAKKTFGAVGYNWMTKENRSEAIEVYLNYLEEILKVESIETPIIIIGFSQGSQTAYRFAHRHNKVRLLIGMSGLICPEIEISFYKTKSIICYDPLDPFLVNNNWEVISASYAVNPHIKLVQHNNKHQVYHPVIQQALLENQ